MFDWWEYLTQATSLAQDGTEVGDRSAISRAYYATFCKARNQLRDNDGIAVPTTGAAHRAVWESFETHTDLVRRQIGILGRRLRTARNQADYDDAISGLTALAAGTLADASELRKLLAKL